MWDAGNSTVCHFMFVLYVIVKMPLSAHKTSATAAFTPPSMLTAVVNRLY